MLIKNQWENKNQSRVNSIFHRIHRKFTPTHKTTKKKRNVKSYFSKRYFPQLPLLLFHHRNFAFESSYLIPKILFWYLNLVFDVYNNSLHFRNLGMEVSDCESHNLHPSPNSGRCLHKIHEIARVANNHHKVAFDQRESHLEAKCKNSDLQCEFMENVS